MNKILLVLVVLATSSACATVVYPDGRRQRVYMAQTGVIVTVTNNCSAFIDVERGAVSQVGLIPFGGSARIPLSSRAYSGTSRRVPIEVKAYDGNMGYIGSVAQDFHVSTYRGTQEAPVWSVDQLRSPSGARCPSSVR